jgi:large subunit ribosomal protein L15
MKLSNLKPATGSVKNRKRIARGTGSGHGGTSTRGHKGAKARAGFKSKRAHEGGQMPLQMRLPKSGFKNTHPRYQSYRAADYVVFNLNDLSAIAEKHNLSVISNEVLYNLGYIGKFDLTKVLGHGELNIALTVSANRFSASAKVAISNAGGHAMFVFKTNQLQGIALAGTLETVSPKEVAQFFSYFEENDKLHVVAEGSLKLKFNVEAHSVDAAAKTLLQGQGANVVILS